MSMYSGFLVVVVVEYQNCQLALCHREYQSQLIYRLQLRCLHEAFPYLRLRYRLQGGIFTHNHSTLFTGTTQDCATAYVPPRGVFTQNHITFFTVTTQDCATALLVVGPSPQGVSQLRYRQQLCCLHEALPYYLRLRYRLQLVASTKSQRVLTHITLFTGTTQVQDGATALLVVGALPQGVSQWRYQLQLCCLREVFSYLSLRYQLQHNTRCL